MWGLCSARCEQCECVCECVAAQSLMLLLVGPSLLRHRAGQVEEEGASMKMSLLSLAAVARRCYIAVRSYQHCLAA